MNENEKKENDVKGWIIVTVIIMAATIGAVLSAWYVAAFLY